MKFSVEWIDGARNASAEERATLCDLQITVGGKNSCSHWDDSAERPFEYVTVPAVYLAEGIAADWWSIFGGRGRGYPILGYRAGFILPCLNFSCDGSAFEVFGESMFCDNPGLRFWPAGSEVIPRADSEKELSRFVGEVIERLAASGISGSEAAGRWERVSESRNDSEESAFCEAAGALGVDPYSIEEPDASFIETAGAVFDGDSLYEFMAGVKGDDRGRRGSTLEAVSRVERDIGESSRLPDLGAAAGCVDPALRNRGPGERAWAPGYRLARAFRSAINVREEECLRSVSEIAGRLGGRLFEDTDRLSGVAAVISRKGCPEDVRVYLRRYGVPEWSETFNLARAVGDAVCFPHAGCSVVNGLLGSERQAMGRAFAAEFLAPVERVLDMGRDGRDVYEMSGMFGVSPEVVERQIENEGRIREACV